MVKPILGCPLGYRLANYTNPQILIWKMPMELLGKKHIFKQDVTTPTFNLCTSPVMTNSSTYLLSCCINKHINNLVTNWYKKAILALENTMLTHPTTHSFTLINVGQIKDRTHSTTPTPHGYSLAHVTYQDVNAQPDFDHIYYAS